MKCRWNADKLPIPIQYRSDTDQTEANPIKYRSNQCPSNTCTDKMAQITINIDTIPIEYRYSTYPCLCFLLPSISSSRRTPECVRFCQYIVAPWRIIGAHARSLIDSICPKSTLGEVESVVRVCTLTDPILISQVPSLSDSDSDSLSLSLTPCECVWHTHSLSISNSYLALVLALVAIGFSLTLSPLYSWQWIIP